MKNRQYFRRPGRLGAIGLIIALVAGCSTAPPKPSAPRPHYKVGAPYKIRGRVYTPKEDPSYEETGLASWYGSQFQGRATANGEIFDKSRLSAAHKILPLPSLVRVDNLENGRSITLRVNDRGPFVDDRIIDLSQAAAQALGFKDKGLAKVRVRYVGRADLMAEAPRPGRADRSRDGASIYPAPGPVRTASLAPVAPVSIAEAPPPVNEEPDAIAQLLARADEAIAAPPPVAQPPAVSAAGLWVRVGIFFDQNAAKAAQLTLADAGSSRIDTTQDAIGDVHALFIGPYVDETIAQAWLASVRDAGYGEARLVLRDY